MATTRSEVTIYNMAIVTIIRRSYISRQRAPPTLPWTSLTSIVESTRSGTGANEKGTTVTMARKAILILVVCGMAAITYGVCERCWDNAQPQTPCGDQGCVQVANAYWHDEVFYDQIRCYDHVMGVNAQCRDSQWEGLCKITRVYHQANCQGPVYAELETWIRLLRFA